MTHLDPALAAVLENYDLAPPIEPFALSEQGVNNATRGLRTGAGDLVWKTYATQRSADTLLYEHRLLEWLSRQGLPFAVPVPLPTRGGATAFLGPSGWQALFPRLPGAPPNRCDPRQAAAVGAALAQLHGALSGYPTAPRPGMSEYGDLGRIHARVPNPFDLTVDELGLPDTPENATLLSWWREELAALRHFISGPYRALPRQVIHSDIVLANTLFDGGRLVAILDFEFATADARALDLASGLVSTLCLWEGEPHWDLARAFLSGYRRVMPLNDSEAAALPWLVRLRNAVVVVWWLGRDLDAGALRTTPVRINYIRETAVFLEQHAERVRALLTSHV